MNTLTVIAIMIIIFGIAIGCWRGLVRCVLGIVVSIATFLLAYLLSPLMYNILVDKTDMDDYVTERISAIIEEDIENKIKSEYKEKTGMELTDPAVLKSLKDQVYSYDPDKSDQENIINNLSLPKSLKNELLKSNAYGEKSEIKADNFYDYIAKLVVQRAMRMVAYLVTFALLSIIFAIIIIALRLVTKLPVLGGLNRVGGAILGGALGLLFVWIMLAVFANLPGHDICDKAVSQIEDSSILTFIQDNNIIMDIIDKIKA